MASDGIEHKVIDLMAALKESLRDTCHAGRDGECNWSECPQNRDGEPKRTGRDCPLWRPNDE